MLLVMILLELKYMQNVDLDANFYYWVRHVSTSNIVGQFTNGINVTTSKVSSSNVTDFFTADSITVASGVIADATIGTAEIANSAVTNAKIQNAAITNAKINDLSAGKINTGTLSANRISANSINGVQKGTAHTFSTIKISGGSTSGFRAIVSDVTSTEVLLQMLVVRRVILVIMELKVGLLQVLLVLLRHIG